LVLNLQGHSVNVHQLLKLNANVKGGVHFESDPKESFEDFMINRANSTGNYAEDITAGAYAVHEIGKITLKALRRLEERVKSDLNNKN
jgi:hypothetical protein